MAGYQGFSKSNNAVEAEENGLFPASVLAKKLKVKTEAIKAHMSASEWHHTSSHYNKTDYYDGDLLIKLANNSTDLSDFVDEEITEGKILLENLRNYKVIKETKEYFADIEYLTWEGTRKHPKAIKHAHENILVEEKGCFFIFHIGNSQVKKKIGSNGTFVNKMYPAKCDDCQRIIDGACMEEKFPACYNRLMSQIIGYYPITKKEEK